MMQPVQSFLFFTLPQMLQRKILMSLLGHSYLYTIKPLCRRSRLYFIDLTR